MYDLFDEYDHHTQRNPTFPGHCELSQGRGDMINIIQPCLAGVHSLDDSCIIQPPPIDYRTDPEDEAMLLDMLPTRRSR